jgi:hypothetical protein
LEDVATQAIEEVKITVASNRVVKDKMSWWKMFKALLRLFNAKAALALEAELELKMSLFVGIDKSGGQGDGHYEEAVRKFQPEEEVVKQLESIELEIKLKKRPRTSSALTILVLQSGHRRLWPWWLRTTLRNSLDSGGSLDFRSS